MKQNLENKGPAITLDPNYFQSITKRQPNSNITDFGANSENKANSKLIREFIGEVEGDDTMKDNSINQQESMVNLNHYENIDHIYSDKPFEKILKEDTTNKVNNLQSSVPNNQANNVNSHRPQSVEFDKEKDTFIFDKLGNKNIPNSSRPNELTQISKRFEEKIQTNMSYKEKQKLDIDTELSNGERENSENKNLKRLISKIIFLI